MILFIFQFLINSSGLAFLIFDFSVNVFIPNLGLLNKQ